MTTVKAFKREPNPDVIAMFEKYLQLAKDGHVYHAGVMARNVNHTYSSEFCGKSSTKLQDAAQCFEMGIRMLGFASEENA